MRELSSANPYDAVFHFAASALVGESVDHPAMYYHNNFIASAHLLDRVLEAKIPRFIFSSTCAVYGNPVQSPIAEDHPKNPVNPYGDTKLAFERLLKWYAEAYGLNVCVFRYFNAAGATERHGEQHSPETHIIPLLLEVAAGEREFFTIHGGGYPTHDGTCLRDYIHVLDIAQAHILALDKEATPSFRDYNIGTGESYSVLEVIRRVSQVTGHPIPRKVGPIRPGDPATLCASPALLMKELGWHPEHSELNNIIKTAWRWKQRPKE